MDAEMQAAMERLVAAGPVINAFKTWTPRNRVAKREVVECPICKGRLHLAQAASNGHTQGKCETSGCLSWIE